MDRVTLVNTEQGKQLLMAYSADVDVVIQRQENMHRLPTETVIDGNKVSL